MRKAFFLFAVFILFVGVAPSAENTSKQNPQRTEGFNLLIEPTFGVRIGTEGEIVWAESSKGDKYKLSELEWLYTPAFYLGANLGVVYKRLEISFLSKFFIPSHCGTMKDSDWLQDFYYKTGNTSTKTNYSESKNYIKNGHDIELAFAFKFYPTKFLTLRPRVSVNYFHMSFYDNNFTAWYGKPLSGHQSYEYYYPYTDTENRTVYKSNGNFVEYNSHNLFVWTGIQVDFIPTPKIVISLATEAAPLLYTVCIDNHIARKKEYKQYSLSVFYAVRQSASATLNCNSFFSVSLKLSGVLTGKTEGPSYTKNSGSSSYMNSGNAGNYSMYFDAGISAKFTL